MTEKTPEIFSSDDDKAAAIREWAGEIAAATLFEDTDRTREMILIELDPVTHTGRRIN